MRRNEAAQCTSQQGLIIFIINTVKSGVYQQIRFSFDLNHYGYIIERHRNRGTAQENDFGAFYERGENDVLRSKPEKITTLEIDRTVRGAV